MALMLCILRCWVRQCSRPSLGRMEETSLMDVYLMRRSGSNRWNQGSCVTLSPQIIIGKMRRLYFHWETSYPPLRIVVQVYPLDLRINAHHSDYHLVPETWPDHTAFSLSYLDNTSAPRYTQVLYDTPIGGEEWNCYLHTDRHSGDTREYHLLIECWYPSPPELPPLYYHHTITNLWMAPNHKSETNQSNREYYQQHNSYLRLHPTLGFTAVEFPCRE